MTRIQEEWARTISDAAEIEQNEMFAFHGEAIIAIQATTE